MKKYNFITKELLIKEYIVNKKTQTQIAKELKCSRCVIDNRLKKYNIEIRTLSEIRKESTKGNKNGNFKDGRTNAKHYCIECGKEIANIYAKKCRKCYLKFLAKNNPTKGIKRPDLVEYNKTHIRRGKNNPMYGKLTHSKGSYYKQSYMRSSWEIEFAKYCIKNHIKYRYEPEAFEITYKYKGIKKEGTYRPDFYLPETNTYIEIKGWWRDDAKIKFNAFQNQYSKENIKVLMKPELQQIGVLSNV